MNIDVGWLVAIGLAVFALGFAGSAIWCPICWLQRRR